MAKPTRKVRSARRGGGGGHGGVGIWFITFADVMGLLVAFFVMLVAFSTQDKSKLLAVAGSMREAFGVQNQVRYSGFIELPGLPLRPRLKNAANIPPEEASLTPDNAEHERRLDAATRAKQERAMALAAATLRQALQDMPEITEMSKNVIVEETPEGLNIEIVDQDGRAMFPEGSAEPYERTRKLVQKLGATLKTAPLRITITGHSSAPRLRARPEAGRWEMSALRAIAIHRVLTQEGVPDDRFFAVAGKGDSAPLFPDDPGIAANRRVTITLMREAPPMPESFKP
jgi:chemotaxis protein MotB